jgi:hypothetical protein
VLLLVPQGLDGRCYFLMSYTACATNIAPWAGREMLLLVPHGLDRKCYYNCPHGLDGTCYFYCAMTGRQMLLPFGLTVNANTTVPRAGQLVLLLLPHGLDGKCCFTMSCTVCATTIAPRAGR